MTSLLRQFRGLAIALAVLAISAGAVFAAAPSMTLMSSHGKDQATTARDLGTEASESAEPSESPDASKSPEPSESASASPSESPSASPSASPSGSPSASPSESPSASPSASPDNHGALVSTAAQMPTPSGFPNHGAFVSCVAHLDASVAGFDWTTVTPQSCGIVPAGSASPQDHGQSQAGAQHGKSDQAHGKGHAHP